MNEVSIKHPEWLYIDVNGKTSYGYDQVFLILVINIYALA